ncbi:MAG: sugar ABC transporter permease, partial [Defluviitaleaceae bacterium]|nr:sugar ABC transporter permease [Defluviitaleaceae bacterium]
MEENTGFLTIEAVKKGDALTRLSAVVFGLGSLLRGQPVRFALLIAAEIAYVAYMVLYGAGALVNLTTLGTVEQSDKFDEALGIYVTAAGDNSMLFLLYGVTAIIITLAFLYAMSASVRCAYTAQLKKAANKRVDTFAEDVRSLHGKNLHKLLLTWPLFGIFVFTIVPLVFMILIAFTNYDRAHQVPGNLFTWVGVDNFITMFSLGRTGFGSTFFPVLGWTLIWAVFATFSCYLLGMLLAIVINRKGTMFKSFWRFM